MSANAHQQRVVGSPSKGLHVDVAIFRDFGWGAKGGPDGPLRIEGWLTAVRGIYAYERDVAAGPEGDRCIPAIRGPSDSHTPFKLLLQDGRGVRLAILQDQAVRVVLAFHRNTHHGEATVWGDSLARRGREVDHLGPS